MLIRYKKNFEKIAMGLLSFMPEGKDVKKLQETINRYDEDPNWHLFLWKEDDILGAIGIKIEDDLNAVIQHISVTPSHRNTGIGKRMIDEIKKMYQDKYAVCPNDETLGFYHKCDETNE